MKKKVKFAFYTSHRATRLCKFLSRVSMETFTIDIVLHDGDPSYKLKKLCDKNGIKFKYIDYEELYIDSWERNEYLSTILLENLIAYNVDYCFCFGSRILVGDLLDVYRNRIINFHPSLLPSFPGTKAVDRAVEFGALLFGNTAHFIDEGVDTGPIIMQSILFRSDFNGYDSVLDLQVPMLFQIIKWIEEDRIMVNGRVVQIHNAVFRKGIFIPDLEYDLSFLTDQPQI